MNRKTHAFAPLALLAVLALLIAGCGGGSSSTSESNSGSSNENASNESSENPYGGKGGGAYGGGSENKAASAESAGGSGGGGAVVSLGNVSSLGMVLVDSNGMTLYDFHKDQGTTPSCYGACAKDWPPLLTEGKPQVGNGASSSKLGTTERKDGTTQVTYAGHPLYTYIGDTGPGEANGNDISAFGGQWYALMGNGEEPQDS